VRASLGTLASLALTLLLAGVVGGAARQSATKQDEAPETKAEATVDPLPRLRLIARMMVNIEGRHRTQATELEALAKYCDEKRFYELLRNTIRTAHAERADYDARMSDFERDLGPELFARMRAAMDGGPGTAPTLRALIPEPPPPPPPLPHEIEARAAEKRALENGDDAEREQAEAGGG
jgi:hypothetical protein